MKRLLFFLAAQAFLANTNAQMGQPWRGKKCAVVLTYDDGLNVHLKNAIPALDSLGLKGTFYISDYFGGLQAQVPGWRKAAANGHELANHTMFHPCAGNLPGRSFVKPDYDLSRYTVRRIQDEMRSMNVLLHAIDGKTERTFAFPCSDTKIGDTAYYTGMQNAFVAARAVRHEMPTLAKVDLNNLPSYGVNGQSGEEMISWVKKAMEENTLLVFLFHGVGGEHSLNVSLPAHSELLRFLKQNEKDIWIAPVVEVAQFVKESQAREAARAVQQKATQEDYAKMLAQLNIQSTRPGPSGNPQAPNAANVDEAKATQYTSLPDPLMLKNGKKVTTAEAWWKKRRPEIVEDFDREIYGRLPARLPKVVWEVVSEKDTMYGSVAAVEKKLLGHVDNSAYPKIKVDIQLTLATPKNAAGPVPVIMEYGYVFPPGFRVPSPPAGTPVQKSWQEQVLERGWAAAVLVPTSFQADNGAGLTEGIIGLVNKGQPRKPDDWGALRAWGWGASRAIDYFETDKAVDASRVAIEGLSRYGKAALVAMAYEPRIKIGFIGSSGAGGAKILRRVFGEQVENLASSAEYHWFAGNFIKYAGPLTPNDLPVDAHQLVALCAPRPVFISSGSPTVEGQWVDAKGMFLGGVYAGPVYKLLGKKDLGTSEFPKQETNLADGDLAFRQHSGGHTTGPNWPYFLDFASRYFKK